MARELRNENIFRIGQQRIIDNCGDVRYHVHSIELEDGTILVPQTIETGGGYGIDIHAREPGVEYMYPPEIASR